MENRLHTSLSPYLRQHAHNPVHWQEWNQDTLQMALREDKPIFLSIGYSSCHWCHVMEKEAFSDEKFASVVNATMIPIKVDREELPEVDHHYMEEAAKHTENLGWPLNLILTPKGEAIHACTYLPRDACISLVQTAAQWWEKSKHHGKPVFHPIHLPEEEFPKTLDMNVEATIIQETTERLCVVFKAIGDSTWGGIGREPKFPMSYSLQFLMRWGERQLRSFSFHTLRMMARGGLFDQVEGGFFRYAVDQGWCIPHFEKMLYDNALLLDTYSEAYRRTSDRELLNIAERIVDFFTSAFITDHGLFSGSMDADSPVGGEGAYYCYTSEELSTLIQQGGYTEDEIFRYFGFDVGPLIQSHGGGEPRYLAMRPYGLPVDKDVQKKKDIERFQHDLLRYRKAHKVPPERNDAIKTSWNSLFLHSLIIAGRRCDCPEWIQRGESGLKTLLSMMYINGVLFRYALGDTISHEGTLDDYAFTVRALITLFYTTGHTWALQMAVELFHKTHTLFNRGNKYLLSTSNLTPQPVFSMNDGQEPSGASIHIENSCRLADLFLNEESYSTIAQSYLVAYGRGEVEELLSRVYAIYALAPHFHPEGSVENEFLWCCVDTIEDKEKVYSLAKALPVEYNVVTLLMSEWIACRDMGVSIPLAEAVPSLYVCTEGTCLAPITGWEAIDSYFKTASSE